MLIKQYWNLVDIISKTMTDFISQLKPFVIAIIKSSNNDNLKKTLLVINNY